MNLKVLYEDNHLIAVQKLPRDIVQADETGDETLADKVKEYIKQKYNKPGDVFLGIVHRLDRPVGGVVIFARTSKALSRLNKMFQDKEIQKTYWAVVEDKPDEMEGTLTHFLKKDQEKNKSRAYPEAVKGGKMCELDYKVMGRSKNYYYLEIKPKTGRHHQIRVQLSAIGCVIKGDVKYGGKRTNRDGSIHLHARKLEFIHPVKKEPIVIVADPPKDPLWDEFLNLAKNA